MKSLHNARISKNKFYYNNTVLSFNYFFHLKYIEPVAALRTLNAVCHFIYTCIQGVQKNYSLLKAINNLFNYDRKMMKPISHFERKFLKVYFQCYCFVSRILDTRYMIK